MLYVVRRTVPNPNADEIAAGRTTVFDSVAHYVGRKPSLPGLPLLGYLGSGSDHYGFVSFAAVPILVFSYSCADTECNPLYHSLYEVPWLLENIYSRDGWFCDKLLYSQICVNLHLRQSIRGRHAALGGVGALALVLLDRAHGRARLRRHARGGGGRWRSYACARQVDKLAKDTVAFVADVPDLPKQLAFMREAVALLFNVTRSFAERVVRCAPCKRRATYMVLQTAHERWHVVGGATRQRAPRASRARLHDAAGRHAAATGDAAHRLRQERGERVRR